MRMCRKQAEDTCVIEYIYTRMENINHNNDVKFPCTYLSDRSSTSYYLSRNVTSLICR